MLEYLTQEIAVPRSFVFLSLAMSFYIMGTAISFLARQRAFNRRVKASATKVE